MALQDKPKFSLIELLITAKRRFENVAKSDDFVCDPVLNAPECASCGWACVVMGLLV